MSRPTATQAVVDAWAPALTGEPSQPKAVRGAAVALLGNLAALTHPHFSPASAAGVLLDAVLKAASCISLCGEMQNIVS